MMLDDNLTNDFIKHVNNALLRQHKVIKITEK